MSRQGTATVHAHGDEYPLAGPLVRPFETVRDPRLLVQLEDAAGQMYGAGLRLETLAGHLEEGPSKALAMSIREALVECAKRCSLVQHPVDGYAPLADLSRLAFTWKMLLDDRWPEAEVTFRVSNEAPGTLLTVEERHRATCFFL